MAVKASVGGIVKRREAPRLVTGHGLYTGDVAKEGWLHAAFVRSTVAHARIVSVDRDAVLSMPGVVGVFTAAGPRPKGQATPLPQSSSNMIRCRSSSTLERRWPTTRRFFTR